MLLCKVCYGLNCLLKNMMCNTCLNNYSYNGVKTTFYIFYFIRLSLQCLVFFIVQVKSHDLRTTYMPLRTVSISLYKYIFCRIARNHGYTLTLACKYKKEQLPHYLWVIETLQAKRLWLSGCGVLKNSIKPEIDTRKMNWERKWKRESEEIQYFHPTREITFFFFLFFVLQTHSWEHI